MNPDKNITIVDDEYEELDVDVERVQAKPTMYISYTGPAGMEHLCHEIANNIIDEHTNPNSVSDGTASIYYDAEENIISFKDTGRGIPFPMLESACTILHTGSKMNRDYGKTAGENGVGLTVTNALSELFEITSTRDGVSKFLQFKNGVKVNEAETKVKDKSKHGLLVSFKPSPIFLGKEVRLPVESFSEWLQEQSFMLPPDLEITFTCEGLPGKAATVKKTYKNVKGIEGYLEYKYPNAQLLSKPIVIHSHMDVIEEDVPVRQEDGSFRPQNMDRTIDLHVAFNFDPKAIDASFSTFCNNIKNIDGGRHQDGVKNAIASFFLKKTNETKKKTEKTEYTQADVLTGLSCVLNMETTVSTKFESQTKHRLGNEYFYKPVRQLTTASLENFFKLPENKRILNKIIEFIKFNAKLRLEQVSKRNKVSTSAPTFMDCAIITGYDPPNLIAKCYEEGINLELYIVEGDSPGGQVKKARKSNDLQGVMRLKGKPEKIYQYPPSYLDAHPGCMMARILRDILGCGWGKHFSLETLRYARIILSPDSDVDGNHMNAILVANIYRTAPALLEQGYVYRVIYPLYKLMSTKKKKKTNADGTREIDKNLYTYDKNDLYDRYEKSIVNRFRLKFNETDLHYISMEEVRRFLSVNREYYEIINDMSQYMVHPDIIEYIAIHPNTFRETIQELDEELQYDEIDGEVGQIIGDYKRENYCLTLDELTLKKIEYLAAVIQNGNNGIAYYEMYETGPDGDIVRLGRKSIYQIMTICQKYFPDLDARYKGLGELETDEMQELAMDPNNRVLVQFTISDAERLIQTLDELFLDKNANVRKKMIREAVISIDDIDN